MASKLRPIAELRAFGGNIKLTLITMDRISIKAPNPKCRLFLKFTSKVTWRQVSVSLRLPPLLGFV